MNQYMSIYFNGLHTYFIFLAQLLRLELMHSKGRTARRLSLEIYCKRAQTECYYVVKFDPVDLLQVVEKALVQ